MAYQQITNPLPVSQSTASNLLMTDAADGPVTAGTAAAKSTLVGGVAATSAPSPTAGQQISIQLDTKGNQRVVPYGHTGSFSSTSASGTGSAPPTLTVPSATKWVVRTIVLEMTLANSGSPRTITCDVKDAGGSVIGTIIGGVAGPVNTLTRYTCGPGVPTSTAIVSFNANIAAPTFVLGPGFTINPGIALGVAGDTLVIRANIEVYPD